MSIPSHVTPLTVYSPDLRKDTAASGSYVGVITVTSFFLWYRPIYLGYAKENGLALFFCESPLLPTRADDLLTVLLDAYFFFAGWHLLFSL